MEPTSKTNETRYLREQQYERGNNLNARIRLHQEFGAGQNWYDWVFDNIVANVSESAFVLEVGCGTGQLWRHIARRRPATWDILLGDFSTGMVVECRDNLSGERCGRYAFAVLDATQLPVASGQCDALIANHMLYHVADRPAALAEMRRVLKPGAPLLAATNSADNYMNEIHAIVERFRNHSGFGFGDLGSISFNLENGAEQISKFFESTEVRLHENYLRVTDAQAIIDYLSSYPGYEEWPAGTIESMRGYIEAEIAARGAFVVTKRSGMFVARNA